MNSNPEGQMHTPESWVRMFNSRPPEDQLSIAQHVLENAGRGARCLMENHQGAVEHLLQHECPGAAENYEKGYKDAVSTIEQRITNELNKQ